jgi:hypothetical protein
MILSRWRYARAARSAKNVASEPVEVNRTCSAHGTARQISSARRIAGSFTRKYVVPFSSCSVTARTTAGCAWPRNIGPEPRR